MMAHAPAQSTSPRWPLPALEVDVFEHGKRSEDASAGPSAEKHQPPRALPACRTVRAAVALLLLFCSSCDRKPDVPLGADLREPCDPHNRRCKAGLYCQSYDFGQKIPAVCAQIPADACTKPQQPTCATNGKVYQGACVLHAAGADVSYEGGCALQPGQLPCGQLVCNAGSYCYRMGACFGPPQTECRPIPDKCQASPSCECLGETSCRRQDDGSLLVYVPGG